MKMIYFAHPVAGGINNAVWARRWIRFLRNKHPGKMFVSQWLIDVEDGEDENPDNRALGLERCKVQVERCDEIWLYGSHVSPGMLIEADHACANGVTVRDFTGVNRWDHFCVLDMEPGGIDVDG